MHTFYDLMVSPLSLRSYVGYVDSMMEYLLHPDQYLITAIDPVAQTDFTAKRLFSVFM